MQTIYKYQVQADQTVTVPAGAKILHAMQQRGGMYVWALVDDQVTQLEIREMKIYGTGQAINYPVGGENGMRYINTMHLLGGELVFHAFETGISHQK